MVKSIITQVPQNSVMQSKVTLRQRYFKKNNYCKNFLALKFYHKRVVINCFLGYHSYHLLLDAEAA